MATAERIIRQCGLVVLAHLLSGIGNLALAQTELRPNVVALPAFDISVVEDFGGFVNLHFAVETWNAGDGPLEIRAGGVTQRNKQNVFQRVYNDDGTYTDYLAGKFDWHPEHNHFHFDDYALYTLKSVTGNHRSTSSKTTFCLIDTEKVDGSLPGAPKNAVYDQCGNSYQGISVGWGDIYGSQIPGQSIDLSQLEDGQYQLIIEADPKNRLLETNEDDNISCVLLDISVTTRSVQVLNGETCDAPSSGGGGVTVTGISPNVASETGPAVDVVISGTGFADGMQVSFENGTGSQPVASQVVVLDDTTISASVSVKTKGRRNPDNVWDVRVGTGVLKDGFTIVP